MEGLSLEYLPWILFAIAVVRLAAAGRHVAEARAEVQHVGERLQAALRLLDERAIPVEAAPRPARPVPARRPSVRSIAPAL